jgi:hypothetical protein
MNKTTEFFQQPAPRIKISHKNKKKGSQQPHKLIKKIYEPIGAERTGNNQTKQS